MGKAKSSGRLLLWEGHRGRELMVYRPCSCGCDARLGVHGVGYLSGSDPDGNGFTLWIEDEAMYQRLAAMLRDRGEPALPISVRERTCSSPSPPRRASGRSTRPAAPSNSAPRRRAVLLAV